MSNLRKKLYKPLLVLIIIIIAFVITGYFLQRLNISHSREKHILSPQFGFIEYKNGYILWRNYPSTGIRFVYDSNPRGYFGTNNEIDHHTNSWGFRGEEFFPSKSRNTFRIAFLGDSYTFGEGVKDTDTYAEQTAMQLKKKYSSSTIKLESYNFGVGGYSFVHEWLLLNDVVLKTKPDVIVFKIDIADFETPLFQMDPRTKMIYRAYRGPTSSDLILNLPPDHWLLKYRVFEMPWQAIRWLDRMRKIKAYYRWLMTDKNPGRQQNLSALHSSLQTCRERNIQCYVVCFPVQNQLVDEHTKIRKEVESEGVFFIDLLPHVKHRYFQKLHVHPTDGHPNEIMHALVAKLLADKIAEDFPHEH